MEGQMQGHEGDNGQGEMEMMDHRRPGGMGMGSDRQRNQRDMERQQEIEAREEELSRLDGSFPMARLALELDIHRLRGGVPDMIEVVPGFGGNPRKCKVRCRVAIPQNEFPGVNFVGKLLGQGGTTLRRLQEECSVKMAILGQGSMRDQQKEHEAFRSGEPKYQHLKQPLHLQIDCVNTPEEAYYRISQAVYEVKTIMTPNPTELAEMYGNPMGGMVPYSVRGGRGRGGMGPYGGFGGPGFDGAGDMGFRGRGRGRGFGRGGPRGRGGASADNGQSFGEDYDQSYGGGKSFTNRGRGASRRAHPYARGM